MGMWINVRVNGFVGGCEGKNDLFEDEGRVCVLFDSWRKTTAVTPWL